MSQTDGKLNEPWYPPEDIGLKVHIWNLRKRDLLIINADSFSIGGLVYFKIQNYLSINWKVDGH